MRPAWAAIDLKALHHNLAVLRNLAPERKILAILKANAYGHGLIRIAQELPDIEAFGVARVEEALQLRNAGVTRPIVLLEGFFEPEQLHVLSASNIQPVVHTESQLDYIESATNLPQPLRVWLKVDTGMHRLGVEPEQFGEFSERLEASANVSGAPVLMSHFACADIPEHPLNKHQQALFTELVAAVKQKSGTHLTSFANSAALLNGVIELSDWVRPGLALYGVSPFSTESGTDRGLKPVMNLRAGVISVRELKAGESVGYGASWTAKQDTRIGIVAIGYGDGYPRHAPQGTPVWINGVEYPLVGRVAMDMVTVELGAGSDVQVGDEAELWGAQLPVERIAQHVGTIPWELLCNVARRVELEYLN